MMDITPELLEKYQMNQCTPMEQEIVELWLEDTNYQLKEVPKSTTAAMSASVWAKLSNTIGDQPNIPLFRKVARYAAVACVSSVAFYAGFIVSNHNQIDAKFPVATTTKSELHIISGNRKTTKVKGSCFDMKFSGMLKLYNASMTSSSILCGDKTFTLEPRQMYYLRGTEDAPLLVNEASVYWDSVVLNNSDFSIHVIHA